MPSPVMSGPSVVLQGLYAQPKASSWVSRKEDNPPMNLANYLSRGRWVRRIALGCTVNGTSLGGPEVDVVLDAS